jgi:hypothetical protein
VNVTCVSAMAFELSSVTVPLNEPVVISAKLKSVFAVSSVAVIVTALAVVSSS